MGERTEEERDRNVYGTGKEIMEAEVSEVPESDSSRAHSILTLHAQVGPHTVARHLPGSPLPAAGWGRSPLEAPTTQPHDGFCTGCSVVCVRRPIAGVSTTRLCEP